MLITQSARYLSRFAASKRHLTVIVAHLGIFLLLPSSAFQGPPQPTTFSFNESQGYAGVNTYVATIGNSAGMIVDLRYTLAGESKPDTWLEMNSNGQYTHTLRHDDILGKYTFTAMKNRLRADWVSLDPLNPAHSYTVLPPQPTGLTASPSSVKAGQGTYILRVGNGESVLPDIRYTFNNGPVQTIYGWPPLTHVPGTWDGEATIIVGPCTRPGTYVFTAIRNRLNTAWMSPSPAPSVYVTPPSPPAVTSKTPTIGTRGSNVTVTINGTNLCDVRLSTAHAGLSFSNVSYDTVYGAWASATFNISTAAATGSAAITLSAAGGTTTLTFTISNTSTILRKEYIHSGNRVISTEVP